MNFGSKKNLLWRKRPEIRSIAGGRRSRGRHGLPTGNTASTLGRKRRESGLTQGPAFTKDPPIRGPSAAWVVHLSFSPKMARCVWRGPERDGSPEHHTRARGLAMSSERVIEGRPLFQEITHTDDADTMAGARNRLRSLRARSSVRRRRRFPRDRRRVLSAATARRGRA